jgi:hypothetical protein
MFQVKITLQTAENYRCIIQIKRLFYACYTLFIYFLWQCSPERAMASSSMRFLDHTQRRATVGRTSLGRVISSSQRPLPNNTHTTDKHPCPPVEFEPTIAAGDRP